MCILPSIMAGRNAMVCELQRQNGSQSQAYLNELSPPLPKWSRKARSRAPTSARNAATSDTCSICP